MPIAVCPHAPRYDGPLSRLGRSAVIRQMPKQLGIFQPDRTDLPELMAKQVTIRDGRKVAFGLRVPNLPNDRGFEFFHGFLGDMMDDSGPIWQA